MREELREIKNLVPCYIAEDGREFDSKNACVQYERSLKPRESLKIWTRFETTEPKSEWFFVKDQSELKKLSKLMEQKCEDDLIDCVGSTYLSSLSYLKAAAYLPDMICFKTDFDDDGDLMLTALSCRQLKFDLEQELLSLKEVAERAAMLKKEMENV